MYFKEIKRKYNATIKIFIIGNAYINENNKSMYIIIYTYERTGENGCGEQGRDGGVGRGWGSKREC